MKPPKPSDAGRWGPETGCPASVKMQQIHPDTSLNTADRDAGLRVHAISAEYLRTGKPLPESVSSEEMFCVYQYVSAVRSVAGAAALDTVEQTVEVDTILPTMKGVVDAWFFDVKTSTLFIWDYKNGTYGIPAFENWQLIVYASKLVVLYNPRHVHLTIVQPRNFRTDKTIGTWECSPEILIPYWASLKTNAQNALSDNPRIRNGKHCAWCSARVACGVFLTAASFSYESTLQESNSLVNAKDLSYRMLLLKEAKRYVDGLYSATEQHLTSLIHSSEVVPGWSLPPSSSRITWDIPHSEVKTLGDLFNVELMQGKPFSPKQAETLGIPKPIVRAYSSKKSFNTGTKLHFLGNPEEIFKK